VLARSPDYLAAGSAAGQLLGLLKDGRDGKEPAGTAGSTTGITPPALRNHRHATDRDTPITSAASPTTSPARINAQHRR